MQTRAPDTSKNLVCTPLQCEDEGLAPLAAMSHEEGSHGQISHQKLMNAGSTSGFLCKPLLYCLCPEAMQFVQADAESWTTSLKTDLDPRRLSPARTHLVHVWPRRSNSRTFDRRIGFMR